jgi:hypothetical protein
MLNISFNSKLKNKEVLFTRINEWFESFMLENAMELVKLEELLNYSWILLRK